jgi:hypothetical protein
MSPTKAMLRALHAAAARERGTICPIRGIHAAAEQSMLKAMFDRGLIEYTDDRGPHVPLISQVGRDATGQP